MPQPGSPFPDPDPDHLDQGYEFAKSLFRTSSRTSSKKEFGIPPELTDRDRDPDRAPPGRGYGSQLAHSTAPRRLRSAACIAIGFSNF